MTTRPLTRAQLLNELRNRIATAERDRATAVTRLDVVSERLGLWRDALDLAERLVDPSDAPLFIDKTKPD